MGRSRPRRTGAQSATGPEVLAVDSNYDPVSRAAFAFRQQHVYPYLESRDLAVRRCQGQMARRTYVAQEARRPDVGYITGTGHGSYTAFTGDHYDPLWQVGRYEPEEVRGKMVHLLACQTAAKLGPDLVAHGCRAFFGYDENFVFGVRFAERFFACDAELDQAVADGDSAQRVYQRAHEKFTQTIEQLEAEGHDYMARVLEYNRDHLCAPSVDARWGDPKARLGPLSGRHE